MYKRMDISVSYGANKSETYFSRWGIHFWASLLYFDILG